jgi:hypothetical protein
MKTAALDDCLVPTRAPLMDTALSNYFRCPDEVGTFSPEGPLSREEGYFVFRDTICYGRCSDRQPAEFAGIDLPDVTSAATSESCRPRLPFDLSEVIGNLRLERYRPSSPPIRQSVAGSSLPRHLYYLLRPMLPVGVRKHLQKAYLNGWARIVFPRWPVDVSVDALMECALGHVLKTRGVRKVPFIWFWPDGANACAILTHDVEGVVGRKFCGTLMDMDDSFGLKSAFQVIPEGRGFSSKHLIDEIRSRGFEVNLHDLNHDGYLFRDRQQFQRRAEQINRYAREFECRGFRAGAMYRDQAWFESLDFSYDMSVPNVAHLEPQRGGCCTVRPYFVGNLLELPLTTVQDYSLFHILGDYSIDLWKKQIDLILEKHGLISVLVHPDYLNDAPARAVYTKLLAHLVEVSERERVWMALPGDVDRWWRDRSAMTLCSTNGRWRVEGPGSERARVAYASLEGNRLVYRLDTASS